MEVLSTVVLAVLTATCVYGQNGCTDLSPTCRINQRYCRDPNFVAHMRIYCRSTCGLCTTGGTCRDNANCRFYPSNCQDAYYKSICPQTCGLCGQTTQAPPSTKTYPPHTGGCGKPQVSAGRVINGQTAKHGAWPWQILMTHNGRPGCGGSIISPYWVVTAAHCVDRKEYPASAFSVRVGEHTWNDRATGEADHRVVKVIKHPSFSMNTFDADIALFKLEKPIQFNKYVSPVCLPSKEVPVGTECYITGWGKINHPGQMHPILQQARMKVVDNNSCYQKNSRYLPFYVTRNMICAGDGGVSRTSGCHGDSGGPFVCRTGNGGAWELHGAVSYGSGKCSSRETYTVFARVHALRTWVEQQMSRN